MLHGLLVTYRRPDCLRTMLAALRQQTVELASLVVVDNAPSTAAAELVRGSGATYLPQPDNVGPAGGIAAGMQVVLENASERDLLVLLDDDDPPVLPDALERMERFFRACQRADPTTAGVGLAGSRLDVRTGRLVRISDTSLRGRVPVDYIGGSQLPTYLVAAVRRAGPFDADLFFGFEELEYGLRLRRMGYALFADGERWRTNRAAAARSRPGAASSPLSSLPAWRRYYSIRNAVVILRRYGHWGPVSALFLVAQAARPVLYVARSPVLVRRLLALNGRALLDGVRGDLGRTVEPSSA